jgi:hypothetical protein
MVEFYYITTSLQTLISLGLVWVLWRGKLRGPIGPPGPVTYYPTQAPKEVSEGIGQRLRFSEGEWKHDGWIRHDSKAWEVAYDTPGLARRRDPKAVLELGVQ